MSAVISEQRIQAVSEPVAKQMTFGGEPIRIRSSMEKLLIEFLENDPIPPSSSALLGKLQKGEELTQIEWIMIEHALLLPIWDTPRWRPLREHYKKFGKFILESATKPAMQKLITINYTDYRGAGVSKTLPPDHEIIEKTLNELRREATLRIDGRIIGKVEWVGRVGLPHGRRWNWWYDTEEVDKLGAGQQSCMYLSDKVDINNSNILQIKTNFEINKFTLEYGLSRETSVWRGTYIDWVRVSLKYDGIEINLPAFPDYREFPELRWFYGWDVASGCVWNLDKVKIELVGTLKDNVVRVQDYTTKREQKEPWQMTKGEFAKTAIPLPDRKDFIKAWLKDNEDIPNLVKPGINYIEQRNGSLLVYGNQRGQAIGIISFRKDAVEHIAVSDRYKGRGIATQLLEESRKYGVRRVIGAISPEAAGVVHRFVVKTAFLEGKLIPPEVLREYLDLMAKVEKQRWRKA